MIEVWVSRFLLVGIVIVASLTLWVTLGAVEEQQAERQRVLAEEAARLSEQRDTAARLLGKMDTVLNEIHEEQIKAARSREQFAAAGRALLEALGVVGDPFVEPGEPPVTPRVPRGVEPRTSQGSPQAAAPAPSASAPTAPPAPAPAPAPPKTQPAPPPQVQPPRRPPAPAPRPDPAPPAPQAPRSDPGPPQGPPSQPGPKPDQAEPDRPSPGRITESPQPRTPPNAPGRPEPSAKPDSTPGAGRGGGKGREHAPGQQRDHTPPGHDKRPEKKP